MKKFPNYSAKYYELNFGSRFSKICFISRPTSQTHDFAKRAENFRERNIKMFSSECPSVAERWSITNQQRKSGISIFVTLFTCFEDNWLKYLKNMSASRESSREGNNLNNSRLSIPWKPVIHQRRNDRLPIEKKIFQSHALSPSTYINIRKRRKVCAFFLFAIYESLTAARVRSFLSYTLIYFSLL